MTSCSPTRGAVAALAGTTLLWAYSWVVMKQALHDAGPFDFAALRYLFGAMVLFVALLVTRQPLRPPPLLPTIALGLTQTAAFQGLAQWALVEGGAGRVALLAYTMPFWAVLLAWPVLGERLFARHWIGLLLAAVGLVLIIAPWQGLGSPASTALALVSGAAWAVGTVLSKRMFRRYAPSPLNLTAWQMLVGALALAVVAWWVPQRPVEWNAHFVLLLGYSAVLASAVAWGLWLVVLRGFSTAVASLASLGVPIVSVLLAWPLLHERPTAVEVAGIALVLGGLIAVSGVLARRSA